MSIPSISPTHTSPSVTHGTSSPTQPSSSGLSSVGSSISSSNNHGTCSDFFSCILSPFKAVGKFFNDAFSKIVWFVFAAIRAREDAAKVAFIENNLHLLHSDNTKIVDEVKRQFSHIFHPKLKLELIKSMICKTSLKINLPLIHHGIIRQFYARLDINTQHRIEKQIWMANGQNDNGEGINFGRNVVDRDITSPLVLTAIDNCLAEGW